MSWQLIDTAPRDGTPIDLWHTKSGRLVDIWWDDGCWISSEEDPFITHWMMAPLPPYPPRLPTPARPQSGA
jgi:hypothetical protein